MRPSRSRPADHPAGSPENTHGKPADQATIYFRNTGKPRIAQEEAARITQPLITAHRKNTEWSALEKPVAPLTESAACRKIRFFSSLKLAVWSWRRDLNPRPSDYKSDALPTELRQQLLGKDAPSRKLIPLIPARCPGQLFKVSQREV